jgi:hypothetical protein
VEVVLLFVLGSGAAPSIEGATLTPAGAASVAEGAPGASVCAWCRGGSRRCPCGLWCAPPR